MNSINHLTYSKDGLKLTESFEGLKTQAYLDSTGIPTIGYGHTLGVHLGMTCTQEQAEEWLLQDIEWCVDIVNKYVKIVLTQNEFDAIVDFVFNLGVGNFLKSSMYKYINSNEIALASQEFEKWDKAGGVVVAGLLRRRIAEETLFKGVNG